jgi:hypothetical protein
MSVVGPCTEAATNSLMAMSATIGRDVTRASPRFSAVDPRPAAKCRVATTGARLIGRARKALASAAVMWTWTRSS